MTQKNTHRYTTLILFCGHLFEHFENSIFVFSGVFVASYFFSTPGDSWLSTYGVYIAISSGFIMAPFGAAIFSWIGDKMGRRLAILSAYVIGVIPTLIIPFIPSYASIGVYASILLIVCRLVQGIGSGGAFSGRIVFMSEISESSRNLNMGILISLGFAGALLGTSLMAWFIEGPLSWGWKIPYMLAGVMGVVLVLMRHYVQESAQWESAEKSEAPIPFLACVREYGPEVLVVLLLGMGMLMPFYFGVSWMSGHIKQVFQLDPAHILKTESYLMIASGVSVIFFFWLSTFFGLMRMLVVAVVTTFFIAIGLYVVLEMNSLLWITVLQFVIAVHMGILGAPTLLLTQKFFPVKYRYSGFSVPFAVGQALMTGTTPLMAELITNLTGQASAATIVVFLAGLFYVGALRIIWRRGHGIY